MHRYQVKSWHIIGISVPKLQSRVLFLNCICSGVVVYSANSKHIATKSPVCAIYWLKQVMRAEMKLIVYILEIYILTNKTAYYLYISNWVTYKVNLGENFRTLPALKKTPNKQKNKNKCLMYVHARYTNMCCIWLGISDLQL